MLTAALLIMAQTWKLPRCPPVGETDKLVHPDNEILVYSAKKKWLSSHEKTWKKLKCILLNERSQSEKATHYDSNYMTLWKRQICGDSKKTSGCQEGVKEEGEKTIGSTKNF